MKENKKEERHALDLACFPDVELMRLLEELGGDSVIRGVAPVAEPDWSPKDLAEALDEAEEERRP